LEGARAVLDHIAFEPRHRGSRPGEEHEATRNGGGSGRESELELSLRHPPAYPPGVLTVSLPGLAFVVRWLLDADERQHRRRDVEEARVGGNRLGVAEREAGCVRRSV